MKRARESLKNELRRRSEGNIRTRKFAKENIYIRQ